MQKTYPLSPLSKARLKRNNLISLTCVVLTIATAVITSNLWIGLATIYFLAKLYYRGRIMLIADPYLTLSDDGLTHHWSRDVFIPWAAIEEVVDTSKHVISIRYRHDEVAKPLIEKIYKWRFAADPAELIALIRAQAKAAASL